MIRSGATVARCDWDTGDTAITQLIGSTHFPDQERRLWVECGEVEEGKPCWVRLPPEEHG